MTAPVIAENPLSSSTAPVPCVSGSPASLLASSDPHARSVSAGSPGQSLMIVQLLVCMPLTQSLQKVHSYSGAHRSPPVLPPLLPPSVPPPVLPPPVPSLDPPELP